MKLHLANVSGLNIFSGYGDGYVIVNQERYVDNMIVLPEQIVEHWPVSTINQLDMAHFDPLLAVQPEIILLGTGAALQFPDKALMKNILARGIGLEVMDTQAACRTYNILTAEERHVAAAIFI
ncbi:hypothetical protein Nstercoris_02240 [Nitrosomonas stercoris]|uniref:Xcc1710-like domain-containing protein n=1 Tax=Nitrosomonas stercoris TaxID=1444684 RepID=A0A4Y1YRU4_9PROT|nr:hypothetical protein Nstercoris_02240 [Nitrosomonas stercoris]